MTDGLPQGSNDLIQYPSQTPFTSPTCRLHPQTTCPAFVALRMLSRLEGAQPVLVTDAGCFYGLSFINHFYGARKSILAPAVGTAELSSGKLQEAALAAIEEAARDPNVSLIPVLSLCVSETAGLVEELLPRESHGKPVVLIRMPSYAVHAHPDAKDIVTAVLLRRFADTASPTEEKTLVLLGEVFAADPLMIDGVLRKMGARVLVTLPGRRIDEVRLAGRGAAVAALHPFYRESLTVLRERGVAVVGGAPSGAEGTAAWLHAVGMALELDEQLVEQVAREEEEKALRFLDAQPLKGFTVLVSGYDGNEMPYTRLLVESGAYVPYLSTSIAQSALTAADEAWLRARGTEAVVYRKTFEDDQKALLHWKFDLAFSGTTMLASYAKHHGIPAVYFTNILSVRPLFLSGGMIASISTVRELLNRRHIYRQMLDFFKE
ncbi:MAG: chlorophyllide a reductase subunit Y [Chloroflexaceae bacterium]|nr:chlorophyllide a reductase subunit Y [Chloroflexaceae bacterium]